MESRKRPPSNPIRRAELKRPNRPRSFGLQRQNDLDVFGLGRGDRLQPTGRQNDEAAGLQEWYRPSKLLFRESELAQITAFIEKGIRERGAQVSLYITGMPGQGKTACIRHVIFALQTRFPKVGFYYQNGLKMLKPQSIFSKFWKQLSDRNTNPQRAKTQLETCFQEGNFPELSTAASSRMKAVKVMVIDEVDYLLTKTNDVLYTVFDWTHAPYSRLIIVCVANTLDFPQRVQPKIKSRMGKNQVNFAPYSAEQIEKILRERSNVSDRFTDDALMYIARKCASISSDLRKAMHYCRRAMQENTANCPFGTLIDVAFVSKLFEADARKPFALFLQRDTPLFKSLLYALVQQSRLRGREPLDCDTLFNAQNDVLAQKGGASISYSEFLALLHSFAAFGVLRVNYKHKTRPSVQLENVIDDICFALKDDDGFAKYIRC